MPNLEAFKSDRFEGIILKTEDMVLKDYLGTPEKIEAFKKGITQYPSNLETEKQKADYRDARLEGEVTVVTYSIESQGKKMENSEFFNIPKITGWGRSKLKSVRDMNNLPYDTTQWKGMKVFVYINKDGYLRLLPER